MTNQPPSNPEQRVQWAYSAASNDELAQRYDEWAQDYDDDLINTFVWLSPRIGAETLAEYAPAGARILDAGAGTGLVGRGTPPAGLPRHLRPRPVRRDAARSPRQRLLLRLPAHGAGRPARFRVRHVRRRNQHRSIHARTRPRQLIRRAMPNHQTRRPHHLQHETRHPRRAGLRTDPRRPNQRRRVDASIPKRPLPPPAQRRTRSPTPNLGVPSELIQVPSPFPL